MHTWLLLGILVFGGWDGWDWLTGRGDRSRGGNYTPAPASQTGTATAMDDGTPTPPPPKP